MLTVADQPYRLGHSQASVRPEMDVQAHERMIRLGRWALNQLCCMGFRNRKLGLLLVEKFFVFTRPTMLKFRTITILMFLGNLPSLKLDLLK